MSESEAAYAEAYEEAGQVVGEPEFGLAPEEAPFQVGEEIEVGDLSKVQRSVLPTARDVRFEILGTSVAKTSSGYIKYLKARLKVVNGIPTTNGDGELELKHAGKVVHTSWKDLCIWHDPSGPDPKGWWKAQESSREYQLGLKQFVAALGIDLKHVKINDGFHATAAGRHVLGTIGHETDKESGRISEKFGNWKVAPVEEA